MKQKRIKFYFKKILLNNLNIYKLSSLVKLSTELLLNQKIKEI